MPLPPVSLTRRPATRPELVGREPELRQLRNFLREAATAGAARVVYGAAGSGKSELLDAAVRSAADAGMRVLRCAGTRGSQPPELSGLLRIVWPLLASPGSSLAAGQLAALERLLLDGVPARGDWPQLPFAVLGVLESVSAGQPLLIAVDDWEAWDQPSKDVLSFVARRSGGRRLGLLMASRPSPTPPASLAGLPELWLRPLTPSRSVALLAARRPGLDTEAVRQLLATAAGNPLALLELPTRPDTPFPDVPASSDRLAAALAPGLSALPPTTRDLLLVAALHPTAELSVLLSAASRAAGVEAGFDAVEPAELDGLVTVDGTRLLFRHPTTAGAVVHRASARQRRTAHAALAAVLAPDSVRGLWHRSQAAQGTDPDLAGRLEAVHRHALELREPSMAVRLLLRAADLYPEPADRGRCTLRAAQLAHDLGRPSGARTLARRALRLPLGPLGRLCAEALVGRGEDGGRSSADPASWPAPIGAAEQESALELARLTAPAVVGDTVRADALLAFLDRLPHRADDPRLLHAMATADPARRAATVAARLAAAPIPRTVPVRELERLGAAALLAGDPLRALDLHRRAERGYRFRDLPERLPRVLLRQGLAHLDTGDWRQGGHAFRLCGERAEEHGQRHHAAAAALLGHLVRSVRDGAVLPPRGYEREAARRSVPSIDEILAVGTGWARVEGGDFAAGHQILSRGLTGPTVTALSALVPFAEAAAATHAAGPARAVLRRLEDALGAELAPVVAVRFAVARAMLADDEEAEPLYERAFALDLYQWPFLEASLRLALGRRLRRLRRYADSRIALRQAAAGFTMTGADARAARVGAELRASGARADGGTSAGAPRAVAVRQLLSAQELRIAELAGGGLSNRDIAEALDLSPQTIKTYLYRIFPRLGVTARAQLADVLKGGGTD